MAALRAGYRDFEDDFALLPVAAGARRRLACRTARWGSTTGQCCTTKLLNTRSSMTGSALGLHDVAQLAQRLLADLLTPSLDDTAASS